MEASRAELIAYLSRFISQRRRQRIETVLAARTRMITVVVEDVYQPHNASAVLRSCECFGIQDVHVVEAHKAYQVNADVALGASKWLTLHRHPQVTQCVAALRRQGYCLWAATPHEADGTLDELPVQGPTALMLGTEDDGLSQAALTAADVRVRVPIHGFTESFNVSVCAAVMLRDMVNKLRRSGASWELNPAEREGLRLEWYRRSIRSVARIEARYRAEREGGGGGTG